MASRLKEAAALPPLTNTVPDLKSYDTVFLGSPIWDSSLPSPIRTFLSQARPCRQADRSILYVRLLWSGRRSRHHRGTRTARAGSEAIHLEVRPGARHDEQRERLAAFHESKREVARLGYKLQKQHEHQRTHDANAHTWKRPEGIGYRGLAA